MISQSNYIDDMCWNLMYHISEYQDLKLYNNNIDSQFIVSLDLVWEKIIKYIKYIKEERKLILYELKEHKNLVDI